MECLCKIVYRSFIGNLFGSLFNIIRAHHRGRKVLFRNVFLGLVGKHPAEQSRPTTPIVTRGLEKQWSYRLTVETEVWARGVMVYDIADCEATNHLQAEGGGCASCEWPPWLEKPYWMGERRSSCKTSNPKFRAIDRTCTRTMPKGSADLSLMLSDVYTQDCSAMNDEHLGWKSRQLPPRSLGFFTVPCACVCMWDEDRGMLLVKLWRLAFPYLVALQ